LLPGERVTTERHEVASALGRLLAGEVGAVLVLPDGEMRAPFPAPAAVFPGAFNPLHAGHLGLAGAAARRLGVPVTFEISATNVDKPPLTEAELRRRLGQFAMRAPVLASDAPTFVRKSRLFPGCAFVIGSDTLERLFAPRYYGGEEAMAAALAEIQAAGCRFLVAGRHYAGTYRAPHDVTIPAPLRSMFDFIPEGEFRVDVSSTELRR
jgi:nicotinic acid mononucleotide adenylyltransferase